MSAKAQRDLIKGGPRPDVAKREKGSKTAQVEGIPVNDHTERDDIIERLKRRKDS